MALVLLGSVLGAGAAPFCVEDGDDQLWVDCQTDVTGVTRRQRILCRREAGAALMEVPDPALELRPGEGDCPADAAAADSRGILKSGLPRGEDESAPAGAAAGETGTPGPDAEAGAKASGDE